MRVVLVPSSYHPAIGGVEELTRHLASALVDAGDAVEVWTTKLSASAPPVEVLDGIPVRRFDFPMPARSLRALAGVAGGAGRDLAGLLRASRAFHPDLLHVQCFSGSATYAAVVATLVRRPLVLTLQGETVMDDHDIFEVSATLRTSLRLSLGRAAAVTACSRFVLSDAEERFGLRPGRGVVVFNGVPDEPPAAPGPVVPFARYLLGLGRLVEKKGFDLLLRAFSLVAARDASVGLVIGGGGPARAGLEALAAELGVADRVRFAGPLDASQVAAVMRGAELFVMPSRVEPFGIVALEAWRAGTPLIVTVHGGASEFVRAGSDGLVVDPFDTAALAAAITRLLADRPLRDALATAGRRRVAGFAWSDVAARYRDLYRQVLAT